MHVECIYARRIGRHSAEADETVRAHQHGPSVTHASARRVQACACAVLNRHESVPTVSEPVECGRLAECRQMVRCAGQSNAVRKTRPRCRGGEGWYIAPNIGNALVKMIVQPLLMALLITALGVAKTAGPRGDRDLCDSNGGTRESFGTPLSPLRSRIIVHPGCDCAIDDRDIANRHFVNPRMMFI
jgi:hypothetical protein